MPERMPVPTRLDLVEESKPMEMVKSNISGALRRTLKEEMTRDERIFLFGEDIGDPYGGIFKVTKGLQAIFGTERVINSPLSEIAIVGVAVGAAISGMRPIVEIMYADFLPIAMDQLVNNAAKNYFLSGGRTHVPMVVRANYGSGKAEGAQHSQCPEAWFMNFPGLKIVAPSTPRDAQGLLKGAIEDNNPVLFFEHKMLYALQGDILVENETIPLGKADIKRHGTDITIVACSIMVHRALKAAETLAQDGISVEVLDLRTLKPYDKAAIAESVAKTGRLLVVEESPYTGGWGAQIVDTVVESQFSDLKCAPARLAGMDAPLAAHLVFESREVPSAERIEQKVRQILSR
jgi:pyruvate dehydrogenase E1 component beta subunit